MNDDMLEQTADLLRLSLERQLTTDEVKTLCAATGVRWAWVTNRSTEPKREQCEQRWGLNRCSLPRHHGGHHHAGDFTESWQWSW
jgi:hypothetical protein